MVLLRHFATNHGESERRAGVAVAAASVADDDAIEVRASAIAKAYMRSESRFPWRSVRFIVALSPGTAKIVPAPVKQ